MTAAYYSLFLITEVERGVGVSVQDLLRDETGFVVDVGFGTTAQRHLMLGVPDHPDRGLLDNWWSRSPCQSSGGKKNPRGIEADESVPRDLRLQANLPIEGSRACRPRDPNLSFLGQVIKCRLCRTRWSNPLTDSEIGSCTPRKKRSLPLWERQEVQDVLRKTLDCLVR